MERSLNENQSEIVIVDGQMKSPIDRDLVLIIFKLLCSIIGIPLNGLMAVAVLRLRRLHSKPRNIFLMGITVSNLLAFVPPILEIIYYFLPNELLCLAFVFTNRLPDVYLLLNIFLSLMDRYVAIRYPLWHRKKVTVLHVFVGLVFSFTLITVISKFFYIFRLVPLRCQINRVAYRTVILVCLFLFILCVASRVIVYLQTRKLLRDQRSSNFPIRSHPPEEIMEMVALSINNDAADISARPAVEFSAALPTVIDLGVRVDQRMLHKMELDATKTLVAGVTSLFVLCCPAFILYLSLAICRLSSAEFSCSSKFSWMFSYLKQLGLIHAIYHPIMYMAWNQEFTSVFKRKPNSGGRQQSPVY